MQIFYSLNQELFPESINDSVYPSGAIDWALRVQYGGSMNIVVNKPRMMQITAATKKEKLGGTDATVTRIPLKIVYSAIAMPSGQEMPLISKYPHSVLPILPLKVHAPLSLPDTIGGVW